MTFEIHFKNEAIIDIKESKVWYNEQQQGLGKRFYLAVADKIEKIKSNPLAYPVRYEQVRTVTLEKFPFLVHYYIDIENKKVVVLGVIHTSRNPELWEDRLNE